MPKRGKHPQPWFDEPDKDTQLVPMWGPEKEDGTGFNQADLTTMNYMTMDLEDGMEHMMIRCGICNKWGRYLSNEAFVERAEHISDKHAFGTIDLSNTHTKLLIANQKMLKPLLQCQEKLASEGIKLEFSNERKPNGANVRSAKLEHPTFSVECEPEKFDNLMEKFEDYVIETETDPKPETVARLMIRCWDDGSRTIMKNAKWSTLARTYTDMNMVEELKRDMKDLLCKHKNFGQSLTMAYGCKQKPGETVIVYSNRFVPIWNNAPLFNYTLKSKAEILKSSMAVYLMPNAWVEGIEDEGLKRELKQRSNHPHGTIREYLKHAKDIEAEMVSIDAKAVGGYGNGNGGKNGRNGKER